MSSLTIEYENVEQLKKELTDLAKLLGLDADFRQLELELPTPRFHTDPHSAMTKVEGIRNPIPSDLVRTNLAGEIMPAKRKNKPGAGRPKKSHLEEVHDAQPLPQVAESSTPSTVEAAEQPAPAVEVPKTEEKPKSSEVTFEEAKEAGLKFQQERGVEACLSVFEKLGVTKFRELTPEQYGQFLYEIANYK